MKKENEKKEKKGDIKRKRKKRKKRGHYSNCVLLEATTFVYLLVFWNVAPFKKKFWYM